MREIVIGGAQMGPIQKTEPREAVVERMLALMEEAHSAGCDLVVYPELCLTTFFHVGISKTSRYRCLVRKKYA